MTLLHAHAQYIYTVCAKYQKASVKALIQVDFSMYAIPKQKQNKQTEKKKSKFTKLSFCLKFIFGTEKKKAEFTKLSFCQKMIFFGIILLHANVQCVYIVYVKYQMGSVKAVVQIDFPMHALSKH